MSPIPTNYPGALDDGTSLPTRSAAQTILSAEWNTLALAIKAIEAKLGIDSSAVTTSHDYRLRVPTTEKIRYVTKAGNDSNTGRNSTDSFLTPAAAIAALGGSTGQGDIYFGPGQFAWTDTITLGQAMRLHGKSPHASASGGTEFLWSGADDGRPGLITSANASADWTRGLIENIRFTGSGAGMSGGGTCLAIRNAQNAAKLFNVQVGGWGTGVGIKVYSTINSGYPGYVHFENVWVVGADTCWDIEAPMTNLVFTNCSGDPQATHATTRSWIVRGAPYPYGAVVPKTITSSSQSGAVATHIITGHGIPVGSFVDISGTSVSGYHGIFQVKTVPDADTLTVNTGALTGLGAATGGTAYYTNHGDRGTITFNSCKTESGCADAGWQFRGNTGIVMIGCEYFEQTDNAAGIAFEWLGPIHNASGDIDPAPRLVMIDCISQNMEYQLSAPFHGISIKPNNGYTGGRQQHITYIGRSNTTIADFAEILDPAAPQANGARLYARDNGSGKTQLVVVFNTGAVQVLATQP